jgi:hypothetical protein
VQLDEEAFALHYESSAVATQLTRQRFFMTIRK